MGWFGLGRPRSRFGKWMEQNGITQQELADISGVPRTTISDLAKDDERKPSWRNRKKLEKALRTYDSGFDGSKFWG